MAWKPDDGDPTAFLIPAGVFYLLVLFSRAFSERSGIPTGGTEIAGLITSVSRFGASGGMRTEAKDICCN